MDTNRPAVDPENEKVQDDAERSIIDEQHVNNDETGLDLEETE